MVISRHVLLIIVGSLFFFVAEGKVSIRGRILHYDGKSTVSYFPTIEGIHTPYWKEILPTQDGNFLIEIVNDGYGTTVVYFGGLVFRFFHDGGSRISFEIDQSKMRLSPSKKRNGVVNDSLRQQALVNITGDFNNVNRFYNGQLRTIYRYGNMMGGNYYSLPISKANTPAQAFKIVDSLAQIELDEIAMLSPKAVPERSDVKHEEVTAFLNNEVKAFYGSVFMNALFLKRRAQIDALRKDSTAALDIYNKDWQDAFEVFSEEAMREIQPAANSSDYNEFMENMMYTRNGYKNYFFEQSGPLDEGIRKRLLEIDTIVFRDPQAKYAYILSNLQIYLNDQLFYTPALLNAVYDLQKQYARSEHLAYFEPQVEKLRKSIDAGSIEFAEAKIIDKQYSSLSSLLEQFKGHNVLIDTWATWCGPCIQDFQHKDKLKPFTDNSQIEILYISVDRREWEDRWKQSIKFNALAGNHFRADKKFIEDMWITLADPVGVIPRYALVNKSGTIVVPSASRPGTDALTAEISALLKQE